MLDLENIIQQTKITIEEANNINILKNLKIKLFGKRGYFNQQIKIFHNSPTTIRSKKYRIINQAKKEIEELLIRKQEILQITSINEKIIKETLDISLPGRKNQITSFHPITYTMDRVILFFKSIGFSVADGPEVEDNYHNFDALNVPVNHPTRNTQDTFWIDTLHLLRTQTSGVQIRVMKSTKPPIKIIAPGRVYRKDYDKYHTPMFHQVEGLVVDKNVNFCNLKYIMYDFLYNFFKNIGENNIKIRFRPSYFPFTEPSAEIDIMLENNDWLEILGCGMVHPDVLTNVDIDSKIFSGFAFGIGIERLAMLYYGINDLRIFFENDLRFLKQFK